MTDVWINRESGWIVESIESQYIHISTYRPLSGSSYMHLPVELRLPRKGLINIKNKDQKYFFSCHVRHIILQKNIQKELAKLIRNFVSILLIQKNLKIAMKSLLVFLIMMELSFPFKKEILVRLR